MIKIGVIGLILVGLMLNATAQYDRPELNQYRERVMVQIQSSEGVKRLIKAEIDIDYCSELQANGTIVYAYATPEEQNLISYMGYAVSPAPVEIGEDTRDVAFHTYDTLTADLQAMVNSYPNLAKLETLGKSVNGKEIWALKISDNVQNDEAEPEVKYVSTMHGDEVVGMEMCMYLAKLLLEQYGKDTRLTNLVNNTELWLIPDMNPDGTANKRRYNGDWVDLNRNFPDVQNNDANSGSGRAKEVGLMINFNNAHNFCLSLNYHGGAVCVNYLWDTMSGDVPDIKMVKFLSLGYSSRNKPMYNSGSFTNGITNGYAWYEVNGGMQDWNYHWYNDMDFTVEVSATKWPSASTLPGYWEDNRESMLWFMTQAQRGIKGIVTDKATNKPIEGAKVSVVEINKSVVTGKLNGDYHRILMPGTYTVKVTAPGYADKTISNIVVADVESPTVLDIQMTK